ncbi:winged helix-turn-helix transcriptional regulator [Sphingobacterium sp. UGAL515B_05]|uniref:winged helix-turn-helix transcriptional regulator n=1 Tax=Sphingobacterium sp. UGAL515B_05 TaxID=2986767 RepID=UPI0029555F09|nr:winged helix-turn-helix transcriptional regulator [Sphingobacterium sp. UGAL515B_05]WON93626.1 winged helix-turn-helix transcriptional regulator [Sphingobacterium sp. UGAL515B_05]
MRLHLTGVQLLPFPPPFVPPEVEYSLTEFGKTLIPVISALGNWGDEHQLLSNNHFSMLTLPEIIGQELLQVLSLKFQKVP